MTSLLGCNKKSSVQIINNNTDKLNIIPKQTEIYKFSYPMLFNFNSIDTIAEYNSQYKKSKVTTLYNSIPWPATKIFDEYMCLMRGGQNPLIKDFSVFAKYATHAQNLGFKICYLLNSPKPFNEDDFNSFKPEFYKLLDNLQKINIRQIKVANPQTATLINEYNEKLNLNKDEEFKLSMSTILEYHIISQYKNFIENYPNTNHIGIAKDENQNFPLLINLKKLYPSHEIEMMIDEGCEKYCAYRYSCMSCSSTGKYKIGCQNSKKHPIISWFKNGVIKPWQLGYYSVIGINYFKMVPKMQRAYDTDVSGIENYFNIIEFGVENLSIDEFIKYGILPNKFPTENYPKSLTVKELLSYYPDPEYFIKHNPDCNTMCGTECRYCYEKAEKYKNFLKTIGVEV